MIFKVVSDVVTNVGWFLIFEGHVVQHISSFAIWGGGV
jgi:hypothetical protein